MSTKGGFSAFTERVKDVFVTELRAHFSLLQSQNVIVEMPQILKYGLAGQSPQESFINIFYDKPHVNQRVPTVAVMSAPGAERKMGLGRQVIATGHDPDTGLPYIRETVGGDMSVVIEISAPDTNVRSEITDIVAGFFAVYMEDRAFQFIGDGKVDPVSGVPSNYQIILQSKGQIQGETDQPRPEGEPVDRIYFNRVTIPVIFIDYVDREANDVSFCANNALEPEDDAFAVKPTPLASPKETEYLFQFRESFEEATALTDGDWNVYEDVFSRIERTTGDDVIRGLGSCLFRSFEDGKEKGAIVRSIDPVLSGRIRCRFNVTNGSSALVLFTMLQGADPFVDSCYQLIVRNGNPTRLMLVKAPLATGKPTALVEGSKVVIPISTNLAAQLEWKIDPKHNRIRLRGYVTSCETPDFGALIKRLEIFDNTDPYLTSKGAGAGFRENFDIIGDPGLVIIDDVQILKENIMECPDPRYIGS